MGLIDTLKRAALAASGQAPTFDPATLGDPVALGTEWSPAKSGGTNIGTHHLVEISPRRMAFRVSPLALLFPAIFMLVGAGVIAAVLFTELPGADRRLPYFGVPFGSVFFLVGLFLFRAWVKPRIFDRQAGLFWKGREQPFALNRLDGETQCRLDDIHALQLLQEFCRSSSKSGSSSYYSYELNLVLEDGRRINVVDHGRLAQLRADAAKLAAFLNIPVWDAIPQ